MTAVDRDLPSASSDAHRLDATAVAAGLHVDPEHGLDDAEAARRRERYGPNRLRQAGRPPLWRRILSQLADPLIGLLFAAVVVSIIAWGVEGAVGVPTDALAIIAIIALNAVLGIVQESRAERAVAALSVMTQPRCTTLRAGRLRTIPSVDLVPGDVLSLAEGDTVAADARLFRTASLRVAEAALTGESEPVDKETGTLSADVDLPDRTNMVHRGTAVTRGTGRAIVTATGMNTQMGAIATMLDETVQEPTPLQRDAARLGRVLSRIVVAIAIAVVAAILVVQGVREPADVVTVLLLGASLAVAAVPEGLPAILSLVLALGVQRMARRNAVVKTLSSVETLGAASVICTDKTGTLTTNEMTVQRVVTASGTVQLSGAGYAPIGTATSRGHELGDGALMEEVRLVLAGGSLVNDARLAEHGAGWAIEGDPTEAAFLVAARKLEGTVEEAAQWSRVAEMPFSSERKMMSTAHRHENGDLVVLSKGAPDVLLEHCTRLRVGADIVPMDALRRERALADVETLSEEAFRTLAVAYRPAPELAAGAPANEFDETAEEDLVYAGVVGIIDPPRPEVRPSIAAAQAAGIRIIMITGDHPATAARIARDLGIMGDDGIVLPGSRLDAMDGPQLRSAVRTASVFARVAPEHKLRIVDALQAEGLVVAMTGDGVNDAPALKSADIGIAMGITGTEVTKEASDMVLTDDDFTTIVDAVREGRAIFDNIRKFLRYLLYSNMGEVLTVFLGVVFAGVLGFSEASDEAVVLPLLATQILWINLVTDAAPALAMGVDPEIDDVMARPPRDPDERVIDPTMWFGIATTGLTIAVATLATMDAFLPGGLIPGGTDSFEVARTAGFTTLVFAGLFSAFNARSARSSALHGLFTNPWLWGSVSLGVVLQVAVVSLPLLQVAFGTATLDPAHWAVCLGTASLVLWVEELRKGVIRLLARRRSAGAP